MSNIDLNDEGNNYELEQCLQHPNDEIKELGLKKLLEISGKKLENYTNSTEISENDTNLQIDCKATIAVINCLKSPSTKVGVLAIDILYNIFYTSNNCLNDNSIRSNLLSTFTHSYVTKCRIYDLFTRLATKSNVLLDKCEFILQHLVVDANSDDILLQLSVLAELAKLSLTNHGFTYLENNDVFVKISNQCKDIHGSPLKSLLIPGYINFFGTVATKQPDKILTGFPLMIMMLFDLFWDIEDYTLLPAAFDNMGNV